MYVTPIAYPLSITDSVETSTKKELMEDDNSSIIDFKGKQVQNKKKNTLLEKLYSFQIINCYRE